MILQAHDTPFPSLGGHAHLNYTFRAGRAFWDTIRSNVWKVCPKKSDIIYFPRDVFTGTGETCQCGERA